jgi:predicted PolB exonuclease-like 3'-5' exonuclease
MRCEERTGMAGSLADIDYVTKNAAKQHAQSGSSILPVAVQH